MEVKGVVGGEGSLGGLTVMCVTISCMDPKVFMQGFLGFPWSTSTQRQVSSCLIGGRM